MNKQALLGQYEYFKMVHGVTLRLIGTFTDADLDYRPQPKMRSVREVFVHLYGMLKTLSEGVRQGELTADIENHAIPETAAGQAAAGQFKTTAELQRFARDSFQAINEALAATSDEQLAQPLHSPFGTFPTWQYFSFAYDEHWHHRGQLYIYARLLGKEPPMLYDYENSPA